MLHCATPPCDNINWFGLHRAGIELRRGLPLKVGSFLFAGIAVAATAMFILKGTAVDTFRRGPILIPGVQEPEEMRVEPFPTNKVELTAPEKELAKATNDFSKTNLPELLPALARIHSIAR